MDVWRLPVPVPVVTDSLINVLRAPDSPHVEGGVVSSQLGEWGRTGLDPCSGGPMPHGWQPAPNAALYGKGCRARRLHARRRRPRCLPAGKCTVSCLAGATLIIPDRSWTMRCALPGTRFHRTITGQSTRPKTRPIHNTQTPSRDGASGWRDGSDGRVRQARPGKQQLWRVTPDKSRLCRG